MLVLGREHSQTPCTKTVAWWSYVVKQFSELPKQKDKIRVKKPTHLMREDQKRRRLDTKIPE